MNYTEHNIAIIKQIQNQTDARSLRLQKMLDKPDLTRTPNSPVHYIVSAIQQVPTLKGHEAITFPEVVPVHKNFDLLGSPKDHPSRRPSDTFYLSEDMVLRTQTTTMWSYYLRDEEIQKKLATEGEVLALTYGKVYRNDELDKHHSPVFHQIDGIKLSRSADKIYTLDDLTQVLVEIAKAIYGADVKWRVEPDSFPFTTPSIELQIEWNGEWLEVLGAGIVNPIVLENMGISSKEYNGWAFGFGLDRLAMIKMEIPDIRILWSSDERITKQFTAIDCTYEEVSKYPPVDRDISMLVSKERSLNTIYELIRECSETESEGIIEEVKLLDTYENDSKFGKDRISYTFRIRYRSLTETLLNEVVNNTQERVRVAMIEQLGAELR